MRGDQVILESDHNRVALVQALRERVDRSVLFSAFSSKDFAGGVNDDGSFDLRVIHRWSRSGFAPHLLGRMMPGARGTRVEARFDYGRADNALRWVMGPLFTAMALLFLLGRTAADVWPVVLLLPAIGWLVPLFNYWYYRADEETLRALFQQVTGGVAAAAAIEPR